MRSAVSSTRRDISVGRARAFSRGKRQRTAGGDGRGTGTEENAMEMMKNRASS